MIITFKDLQFHHRGEDRTRGEEGKEGLGAEVLNVFSFAQNRMNPQFLNEPVP